MFGSRRSETEVDVRDRLRTQSAQAFVEMIRCLTTASDTTDDIVIGTELFNFLQRLERSIPDPARLLEDLPAAEGKAVTDMGRGVFRQTDELVQALAKTSDEEAVPVLTTRYRDALLQTVPLGNDGWSSIPADLVLAQAFGGLLARDARLLGKLRKRNLSKFEQFGVLTTLLVWTLRAWVASAERHATITSDASPAPRLRTDTADEFSVMLIAPREPIDLLVGVPDSGLPVQQPWHELILNGYLAFQIGALEHARILLEAAEQTCPLPQPRTAELSAIRGVGGSGGSPHVLESVTVPSAERLAFLSAGVSDLQIALPTMDDLDPVTRGHVTSLMQQLTAADAAEAQQELLSIHQGSGLPAIALARLAQSLSHAGHHDDALPLVQVLLAIPVQSDAEARHAGLRIMAPLHLAARRYQEALMTVRELLRIDLSDEVALGALSRITSTVDLDWPMQSLLELRVANVLERRGDSRDAEEWRSRVWSRGPRWAPYRAM